MTKRVVLALVFLAIFLSFATDAQSQWEQRYDFGRTYSVVMDFEFLHQFGTPQVGFITILEPCGDDASFRTTDAGASWTKLTVGGNFAFKSADNGYTTNHRTTDGGATWQLMTSPGQYNWVSCNQWTGDVFRSEAAGLGHLFRSTDEGNSWTQVSTTYPSELTFTNANDGFVRAGPGRYAVTTDGGATWSLRPLPDILKTFGIPNSETFFVVTGVVVKGKWWDKALMVSTNAGQTWTTRNLPSTFRLTSSYSWSGSKIFAHGPQGVVYTADTGKTWVKLCGPHAFYPIYSFNDTVYSYDYQNRLWVNKSLTSSKTLPNGPRWYGNNFWLGCDPYSQECSNEYLSINNLNACDPTIVTSIEMVGSQRFSNLKLPALPLVVDTEQLIYFNYSALDSKLDSTTFRVKYSIQGEDFDTTFRYFARSLEFLKLSLPVKSVDKALSSGCEGMDTTLTLKLLIPCDSLLLVRAWLEDSSVFKLEQSDFPSTIVSSKDTSKIKLRIKANVNQGGTYITLLHIRFNYHDVNIDTSIQLKLRVPKRGTPSIIGYSTTTNRKCALRDTAVYVVNSTCDKIELISAALRGNGIFSSPPIILPIWIAPGDTLAIPIQHTLDTVGSFSDVLKLSMKWNGRQIDTVSSVFVEIIESAPFGVQDLFVYEQTCDVQDTSVLIQNNRCDSIRIESAIIESGPAQILSLFPIVLAPSSTARLGIRFTKKEAGIEFIRIRVNYVINGVARDTIINLRLSILRPSVARPRAVDKLQFSSVSTCASKEKTVTIYNDGCEAFSVADLDLQPQTDFAIVSSLPLPISILPDSSIDVTIRFAPSTIGFKQAKLTTICQNARGSSTLNVAIDGTGNASGRGVLALSQDTIEFGTMTACELDSMLVILGNGGCDSLIVESLLLDGDKAFSFVTLSGSSTLSSADEISLRLYFRPSTIGKHSSMLRIRSRSQSTSTWEDDEITIFGEIILPRDPLTIAAASFTPISLCEKDSTRIPVTNHSCDSQLVSASANGDFSCAPSELVLAPGETGYYTLYLKPTRSGARLGEMHLTSRDIRFDQKTLDTMIALSAEVLPGEKILLSSLNAINFGETNICEERDSLVHLVNKGCDTLTITNADVDKNFSVGGSFPIVLAPGESMDVPVTTIVDTVGKPTVLTGLLNIKSTADNQIAPIMLTRSLYYPTKLRIEAVDEASGKEGDAVKFRMILEGDVPATMTALKFDFLHNNDLLSWDHYDGVGLNRTNVSGTEDERASFVLSPVLPGVIGELTFGTRLALAEQTTLSFDNITFEAAGVSFAPECIAVISDTGTRFNYIYTCGDNIIRDRLNGIRLIKSITPNPAKDEIRVELNVGGSADVSVFNTLGVEVVKSAGERVDVSKLPSGVYYVRVAIMGSVESRRLVISR